MNYYFCSFSYFVKDFFRNLILWIIQQLCLHVHLFFVNKKLQNCEHLELHCNYCYSSV